MKVIIAGSRDIGNPLHSVNPLHVVALAVKESGFTVTEVVSGTARGIDQAGESWAIENGIPLKQFPADWFTHGKAAGYKRNLQMAEYADALIAVWDGESRGTKHMIEIARKHRLPTYIKRA